MTDQLNYTQGRKKMSNSKCGSETIDTTGKKKKKNIL